MQVDSAFLYRFLEMACSWVFHAREFDLTKPWKFHCPTRLVMSATDQFYSQSF